MGRSGDILKGLYDAFARGDVPDVLGTLDSGIEWREADGFLYADGNPYVGPQAVAEGVFQRIVSNVENFAVIPQKVIDGGDTVVVEGRYKGKMKATVRSSTRSLLTLGLAERQGRPVSAVHRHQAVGGSGGNPEGTKRRYNQSFQRTR